jgi:hypothetical protein
MNDSTKEPVTYERLQSVYIYASILMTRMLAMMKTSDYANKMRLKPVLFSNIVRMILSVYALDEEDFKKKLHIINDENVVHLKTTCKSISTEDIKHSSLKMFPMMIRHDDGWVESEDISISERDRFIWWWVDYLCYSVDTAEDQPHILHAIPTCAMFLKKPDTKFNDIEQIFFPPTVKHMVSKKDIIILDPLLCLSDGTNNLFLSYIDFKETDDETAGVGKPALNVGQMKIPYEYQPLNVLLLCATHNFLNIPKKDLNMKVPALSDADPTPIIDNFFQILKEYSVQVMPQKVQHDTTNLRDKLRALLKEQDKMPKMRTYKPERTFQTIKDELSQLDQSYQMQTKAMHDKTQRLAEEKKRRRRRIVKQQILERDISGSSSSDSDDKDSNEGGKEVGKAKQKQNHAINENTKVDDKVGEEGKKLDQVQNDNKVEDAIEKEAEEMEKNQNHGINENAAVNDEEAEEMEHNQNHGINENAAAEVGEHEQEQNDSSEDNVNDDNSNPEPVVRRSTRTTTTDAKRQKTS